MSAQVDSVWCISYWEWSETRSALSSLLFQLCFIICHQEVPRKSGRIVKWDTSPAGCTAGVDVLGQKT